MSEYAEAFDLLRQEKAGFASNITPQNIEDVITMFFKHMPEAVKAAGQCEWSKLQCILNAEGRDMLYALPGRVEASMGAFIGPGMAVDAMRIRLCRAICNELGKWVAAPVVSPIAGPSNHALHYELDN